MNQKPNNRFQISLDSLPRKPFGFLMYGATPVPVRSVKPQLLHLIDLKIPLWESPRKIKNNHRGHGEKGIESYELSAPS